MIRTSWSIAIFLILFPCICLAQGIVAGITGPGDIHTDINPDSVFRAAPVHLSPWPGGEIIIDIDHNGTPDFKLGENGNGGLGGGGGSGFIVPLGPASLILSHTDTSMVYPGVPAVSYVADTFDHGMTIGSNPFFRNRSTLFWSSYYGMAAGPSVQTWVNIGDHYTGVALVTPGDTLYGWILVNISTGGGAYIMSIREYACNINPNAVPTYETESPLRVFPNPFVESFNVRLSGPYSQGTIVITDLCGNPLRRVPMTSQSLSIHAGDLSCGMYILVAETPHRTWKTKIIKR